MTTERWALVPIESTLEMLDAGETAANALNINGSVSDAAVDGAYSAMIQASPGAALLAEVLAARDAYLSAMRDGGNSREGCKNRSDTHFALFTALDKIAPWPHEDASKLRPAAEGAT